MTDDHVPERSARLRVGQWTVCPHELTLSDGQACQTLEPKVMDLLLVLAERPGEVILRETLIERVWAVAAGGDESLTRAVSQLRKALGDASGRHAHIETIPRRGYKLVADVAPLPAGQVAPGTAAAGTLAGTAATAPGGRRPRPFGLAAAAAALACAVVAWLVLGAPEGGRVADAGQAPVAKVQGFYLVDTFDVPEDDPELAEVAQSLESAMLSFMDRAGLRVDRAARPNQPMAEFTLGVSLRKDRVRLRLEPGGGGPPVWTETFEKPGYTPMQLARWASLRPASVTSCAEDIRRMDPGAPPEVVGLVFQFCAQMYRNAFAALPETAESLVELAPDSLIGHALGAYAYGLVLWGGRAGEEDLPRLEARMSALSERALSMDPDNAPARLAQAIALRLSDEVAMGEALRAGYAPGLFETIRLNMLGHHLRGTGQMRESYQAYFASRREVHHWPFGAYRWAYMYASHSDPQSGFAHLQEIEPLLGLDHARTPYSEQVLDHYMPREPALAALDRFDDRPNGAAMKACLRALILLRTGGGTGPGDLRRDCEAAEMSGQLAVRTYAQAGLLDDAFEASFDLVERVDIAFYLPAVFFHPEMAAYRQDPRFWQVMDRFGLVDFWIESGRWPDFCAEPDLGYDCEMRARAQRDGERLAAYD